MEADSVARVLGMREVSQDEFESVHPPESIDAVVTVAYGGCTTGMIVNAAHSTVSSGLHLYSVQGIFMGPAMVDRPLRLQVRRMRDTRTFATRQVEASQLLDDGTRRTCLVVLADFMAQEKAVAFDYSEKPRRGWGTPEQAKSLEEIGDECLRAGKISQKTRDVVDEKITFFRRLFEIRFLPGTPFGDSMIGLVRAMPTAQDGLPIADKVSADWIRSRAPLSSQNEHLAAMAYLMDMAAGSLAAAHNHQGLEDLGVCSSLEFSLRFFSNKVNINEWHLREMSARVGAEGRSFHEIRVWDTQHKLVAILTQQAIMRPKAPSKPKI
jgi:acyl-CoA thioesterase II